MILFAYGDSMNPGQMALRCPEHRTLGIARLMDHRLCFPRYSGEARSPAVSIEPHAGDAVWGVLYEIPPIDVTVINHHEGYDPDGPVTRNQHMLREVTVLKSPGSEPAKAQTYFAVPDGTTRPPTEAYLQTIIDGAIYHGLPKAYVAALQSISAA